jgi:hypothetical protein
MAFGVLVDATAVTLFLPWAAFDWVLLCEVPRYNLFNAARFLGYGGYPGSHFPWVPSVNSMRIAGDFDNPILGGDVQMKLCFDLFRCEPLLNVLNDCVDDIGVSHF